MLPHLENIETPSTTEGAHQSPLLYIGRESEHQPHLHSKLGHPNITTYNQEGSLHPQDDGVL